MIYAALLFGFVVFCESRPWEGGAYPRNVITVPPNCPSGQEWVNGECRDIWRYVRAANTVPLWWNILGQQDMFYADNSNAFQLRNVITVPPNCPPGQQWMNGACRDVWRHAVTPRKNVIIVPPNCPPGQEYMNGECRDVWPRSSKFASKITSGLNTFDFSRDNFVQYEPENTLGPSKNIINVPNQCPIGFRPDALGVCREIF